MDPVCSRAEAQQSPSKAWVQFYKRRWVGWGWGGGGGHVVSPPGSCSVDLHDVVVCGGQHQDLPRVALVEHLTGAEWLQTWHGHAPLLLVAAAHRVYAAPAADARRVCLVVQRLVQQGQAVVLHTAVWGATPEHRQSGNDLHT